MAGAGLCLHSQPQHGESPPHRPELRGAVRKTGAAKCRRVRLSFVPAGSSGCSGLDEDGFSQRVSLSTAIALSSFHLQKACENRGVLGAGGFPLARPLIGLVK